MIFVTNRHCLDGALAYGADSGLQLRDIEVEIREVEDGKAKAATVFFPVINPKVILAASADCALIIAPEFKNFEPALFRSIAVSSNSLANSQWHSQEMHLTDRVYFLGFAAAWVGVRKDLWWDTAWNLPVAREASIASPPSRTFTNPLITTDDVTIVSGHSFSGCSGSPVIHSGASGTRIVGIMSGHLAGKDHQSQPVHGGLSWYTRSPAILDLLR